MTVCYNAFKRFYTWVVNAGLHREKEVEVFAIYDNFPPSITRMPTFGLWKYVTIVSFCQNAKQPLTPLKWFKCLDHG
jgi:hypothetical protein